MSLEWKPLVGLGVLEFGKPIADYMHSPGLVPMPELSDPATGGDAYALRGSDTRVYVEDGRIAQVACYDSCVYKGRNLIGMAIDGAITLVGANATKDPDTVEIDDAPEEIFYIDDAGAQLFVRDGTVVAIYCGPRVED